MTLNELIAQLQQLRAAYDGELQVWILEPNPAGPRAYVGEMFPPDLQGAPEKVFYIE